MMLFILVLFIYPFLINGDIDLMKITNHTVHTTIRHRYARTVITTLVNNSDCIPREFPFFIALPEDAMITEFSVYKSGSLIKTRVEDTGLAEEETIIKPNGLKGYYILDLISIDSKGFENYVTVSPNSTVTIQIIYEQLLKKKLDVYDHILNLNFNQSTIKDLQITVNIEDVCDIIFLRVSRRARTNFSSPEYQSINVFGTNKTKTITWKPTIIEQEEMANKNLNAQFIVQYSVDNDYRPNLILYNDEYFLHFFSPSNLEKFRVHTTFVLDGSGSMGIGKIKHVKQAMHNILHEMRPQDYFSIVIFSNDIKVLMMNADDSKIKLEDFLNINYNSKNIILGFEANEYNVQQIDHLLDIVPQGYTNIGDALMASNQIAESVKLRLNFPKDEIKSIVVLICDGTPNYGKFKDDPFFETKKNSPIFGLGYGNEDEKIHFLNKITLSNHGYSKKIDEKLDNDLQIQNFYKEVSTPVLSDIYFKYINKKELKDGLSKKSFDLYFKGSELIISGKLIDSKEEFNCTINAHSKHGPYSGPGFTDFFYISRDNDEFNLLRKLWAYIHITEMLTKHTITQDTKEKNYLKSLIIKYAIENSFLTPFTSLVLSWPDHPNALIQTEKLFKNFINYATLPKWKKVLLYEMKKTIHHRTSIETINSSPLNPKLRATYYALRSHSTIVEKYSITTND
ncbi:inter-alpha-trypsin inhibitor heavy chain H4-like [Daktulosphaira vitifoliae]|uniref:inter-alpha-trypsin inhibitor heavy chain H4-like n=1 Tax=Daktulosphaira vitifoliae TaxID=58002 RepID=UPI0021A9A931|nr:inter-alpha-trypsin inhibitor heavy chain H4-like [Daktulosphaira vitifoliae]